MSMTADEKVQWAQVFATCPTWCDGTGHLEGDTRHHSRQDCTSHVAVGLSTDDDGRVGVYLFAEGDLGTLTVEEVADVVDHLNAAAAVVRESQA